MWMPWLQLACAVKEAVAGCPCKAASTKAAPLGGSFGVAEVSAVQAPWFEYTCYAAASTSSGSSGNGSERSSELQVDTAEAALGSQLRRFSS